jgi:hypothetical protein
MPQVSRPNIRINWVLVTPKIAEAYLQLNHPDNRRLDPKRVARYSRDMSGGRWIPTHQGIAFDVRGRMVDGQGTCSAILQSKQPQWRLVAKGLSEEAITHMDTGAKRSLRDRIRISGSTVDPKAGVILLSAPVKSQLPGVTESEVFDQVKKYRKELTTVVDWFDGTQIKGLATAVIKGVVFLALLHEDESQVKSFLDVYLDKTPWTAKTESIRKLAKKFINAAGSYYAGEGGKDQARQFTVALYHYLHPNSAQTPETPWVFRG